MKKQNEILDEADKLKEQIRSLLYVESCGGSDVQVAVALDTIRDEIEVLKENIFNERRTDAWLKVELGKESVYENLQ